MRASGMISLMLAGLLLAGSLGGCATTTRQFSVETKPVLNPDVAALSPEDIIAVMRRAGFTDEEIIRLGKDIRNDLAQSGGCQISTRDAVLAVFAVYANQVYISSPRYGTFRYDLETKRLL